MWTKVHITFGGIGDYIGSVATCFPTVAIVDDDEPIRKALSRLLRASDFSVESFSSGQEFLDSLRNRRPHCAVIDFQMQQINGLDVLKELRSRGVEVPVIIITAHDEPAVRASCMAAGASAYLTKPIDEMVLRRAISEAIH